MTDIPDFIELLRTATEDNIAEALDTAYIELPIATHVEALELFNSMLDVLTGVRYEANASDETMIGSAALLKP
jgi:hypothetical protein